MKRAIRWAAGLYPARWRERYGAEFSAMLDDLRPRWRDFINTLAGAIAMQIQFGRFFRTVAGCGIIGAAAAGIFAFSTSAPLRIAGTVVGPSHDTVAAGVLADRLRQAAGSQSDVHIRPREPRHGYPAAATIEWTFPNALITRRSAYAFRFPMNRAADVVRAAGLQLVELHISPANARRRDVIIILEGLIGGFIVGGIFGWLRRHMHGAPLHA